MNPIEDTARTHLCMPQNLPICDNCLTVVRRLLVRAGIGLTVPSVPFLALAMGGVVNADMFAIGGISGLRTVGSIAVLGCLMAAIGYWDDYERS